MPSAPSVWLAFWPWAMTRHTVNDAALGALVPAPVVTVSGPVVAPSGTTTPVMLVADATVKPVVTTLAPLPAKVMAVAPVRLVPVRLMVLPTAPLPGEKLTIVGSGRTVNTPALDTVKASEVSCT